ncbi:hypothetical protein CHS0354_033308 [Potamilus streckersoni]|uniref:Uncharacterized protein n=1 Tax=Potamilus streckersoni TaxID=2493646 RepID=A0AAE0RTA2_9BIVA|nr:hypothetical protein CHS0354_033308 [Potamilus streckersoni]
MAGPCEVPKSSIQAIFDPKGKRKTYKLVLSPDRLSQPQNVIYLVKPRFQKDDTPCLPAYKQVYKIRTISQTASKEMNS